MRNIPAFPRYLGLAGLVPQWLCAWALWLGPAEWRYAALAIGWGYAALILSFLGGMWWGIAAAAMRAGRTVPRWIWVAAVSPSLLAFATYLPWVFGMEWPGPSLIVLAIALIASPIVDHRLAGQHAPHWWLMLRWPLSAGLSLATILLAIG